jgi:catechol 2,3-dioxygenase-like lactoylglutathione lyase family enzyme
VQIEFIASTAVITSDPPAAARLYRDTLGLPLEAAEGDAYLHSGDIDGSRHFGVWPLRQAAQACFGTDTWPEGRTVPQASIEFEVGDENAVQAAADELRSAGYDVLHAARTEPWGQTVARLLTDDGVVVGISFVPGFHG